MVIFDLGGTKIAAHKLILAASSEYFNSMFFNSGFNPLEASVPIGDLDPHVFRMYFVYGKAVDTSDLKTTAQLFRFIDFTSTYWSNKDKDLTEII